MNSAAVHFATREAFAGALLDFINHELPQLHAKTIPNPNAAADTLLFATGRIDSMAILHLIAFIERATGREIPPEKIVMKHFQSVAAIAESFWAPAEAT
jgi:acyl carrier protein